MSTSFLYHGFGIQGYEYLRTRYTGGTISFSIRQKLEELHSPVCGSYRVKPRGQVDS